jgi:hypothetical protein
MLVGRYALKRIIVIWYHFTRVSNIESILKRGLISQYNSLKGNENGCFYYASCDTYGGIYLTRYAVHYVMINELLCQFGIDENVACIAVNIDNNCLIHDEEDFFVKFFNDEEKYSEKDYRAAYDDLKNHKKCKIETKYKKEKMKQFAENISDMNELDRIVNISYILFLKRKVSYIAGYHLNKTIYENRLRAFTDYLCKKYRNSISNSCRTEYNEIPISAINSIIELIPFEKYYRNSFLINGNIVSAKQLRPFDIMKTKFKERFILGNKDDIFGEIILSNGLLNIHKPNETYTRPKK